MSFSQDVYSNKVVREISAAESVQDEKKSVDNAIPKSTAYKTVVLFFLFKEHNGYPHPYNRRIRVAHNVAANKINVAANKKKTLLQIK